MSDISVVEVKPQLVIGMRKRGKYEEIPGMMATVFPFIIGKGIPIQGHPVFVCHEANTEEVMKADREGSADLEVAVPVGKKVEDTGELKCYELPGGKMAKIVHKGPYEDCEPTYEKLFTWIEQNGMKVTGPIREVYLNDPNEVSWEETLTEIYAPVE